MQTGPANAGGWRFLVAMAALIAFVFQSYLTQTHIHFAQPTSATSIANNDAAALHKVPAAQRSAPGDQGPASDDPVKCPLCQAVGYAGHFVTPSAAPALLLPLATISILPLATAPVSARETSSHIWQGRGPPNS